MANLTTPRWPEWRLEIGQVAVDNTAILTLKTRFTPEEMEQVKAFVDRMMGETRGGS